MSRPFRHRGFTLIEILGAFFVMTIILTLVTGIFVENGRQRAAALELMRESLSAAATLDQLAQDLEGALFLANKTGRRPDENPWRFLSEGLGETGAVAVRFVTQNAPLANRAQHASGWVEVAYFLEEDRSGDVVLWRWLSPRPPTEFADRFPSANDDGSARMAIGVSQFGIRFLDTEGEWVDEWDSAFQSTSAPLPAAAEISLELMRQARLGETEDESQSVPGPLHTRRVPLRMPPIDVKALIELGNDDDDDEQNCFTVSECLGEGDSDWYQNQLDDDCGGDDELCDLLVDSNTTCWSEIENDYPGIADQAPETCAR